MSGRQDVFILQCSVEKTKVDMWMLKLSELLKTVFRMWAVSDFSVFSMPAKFQMVLATDRA